MKKYGYNNLYNSYNNLNSTAAITNAGDITAAQLSTRKHPKNPKLASSVWLSQSLNQSALTSAISASKNPSKPPKSYNTPFKLKETLLDEIRSIQKVTKNRAPIPARDLYNDLYAISARHTKRKNRPPKYIDNLSTFDTLKDPKQYFESQRTIAYSLMQDFVNEIKLSDFKPHFKDYHSDQTEKLKILRFYEEKAHKLKQRYQRLLDDDLRLIQDFVTSKIGKIRETTSDIFNEYLTVFQQRMIKELLGVLNNQKVSIFDPSSDALLAKKAAIECDDFLYYSNFFEDLSSLVSFLNENLRLKGKFLAETRKDKLDRLRAQADGIPVPEVLEDVDYAAAVPLTAYMKMFKKSVDNLYEYGDGLRKRAKERRDQEALDELLKKASNFDKSLISKNEDLYGQQRLNELNDKAQKGALDIPDDSPLFKLGENGENRYTGPYWQIHQLSEFKRIKTTHSSTEIITNMLLMENGRYTITSSGDESIRITNLLTQENRLAIPKTHPGGSTSLLLTAQDKIVSGGRDGEIKIFDTMIGRSKGVLKGHSGAVWGLVQPDPSEEIVVSCSEDKSLIFWNLEFLSSYKIVASPQSRPVRAMIRDGANKIIFGSISIFVYSTKNFEILKVFKGHTKPVRSLKLFKRRGQLISSAEDNTLRFWNLDSGHCIKTLRVAEAHILEVFEGDFLVSGHVDMKLRFWDLGLRRLICEKESKIFVDAFVVLGNSDDGNGPVVKSERDREREDLVRRIREEEELPWEGFERGSGGGSESGTGRIVFAEYNELVYLKNS